MLELLLKHLWQSSSWVTGALAWETKELRQQIPSQEVKRLRMIQTRYDWGCGGKNPLERKIIFIPTLILSSWTTSAEKWETILLKPFPWLQPTLQLLDLLALLASTTTDTQICGHVGSKGKLNKKRDTRSRSRNENQKSFSNDPRQEWSDGSRERETKISAVSSPIHLRVFFGRQVLSSKENEILDEACRTDRGHKVNLVSRRVASFLLHLSSFQLFSQYL
jgi:hypothetical protein